MTYSRTIKINKRRRRRRRNPAPAIIITIIVIVLIGTGAYFGYQSFLRYTHPIKYEEYVERGARNNGLDKYLVYAVIKTESGFRPDAVSDVGARGLMQIMEDTFDWLSRKMDDDTTKYPDMFKPSANIRYGCFFIGYLYKQFGSVETAMAAYHAGMGQVNKWLEDKSLSHDGKTLDKIPSSDTAHYVDKIMQAFETYKRLYGT